MKNSKIPDVQISFDEETKTFKAWGSSGGELEFVSLDFMNKMINGKPVPHIQLRFTDHDVQANNHNHLEQGTIYVLEVPCQDYIVSKR